MAHVSFGVEDSRPKAGGLRRVEGIGGMGPVVDNAVVLMDDHSNGGLGGKSLGGSLGR